MSKPITFGSPAAKTMDWGPSGATVGKVVTMWATVGYTTGGKLRICSPNNESDCVVDILKDADLFIDWKDIGFKDWEKSYLDLPWLVEEETKIRLLLLVNGFKLKYEQNVAQPLPKKRVK